MPKQVETDPYATPPLKKDKSAGFVRGAILVGLLAVGGAVAYTVMQTPTQTASLEDQQGSQQLADSGYAANAPPVVAPPEAAPVPPSAPVPRESPRRSAVRHESAPQVDDSAPVPEAPMATPVPAAPAPAQPLPPPDINPSTSG